MFLVFHKVRTTEVTEQNIDWWNIYFAYLLGCPFASLYWIMISLGPRVCHTALHMLQAPASVKEKAVALGCSRSLLFLDTSENMSSSVGVLCQSRGN